MQLEVLDTTLLSNSWPVTSPSNHEPIRPSSVCSTSTCIPTGHASLRRSKAASRSSCRFDLTLGTHRPTHLPDLKVQPGRSMSNPTVCVCGSWPSSSTRSASRLLTDAKRTVYAGPSMADAAAAPRSWASSPPPPPPPPSTSIASPPSGLVSSSTSVSRKFLGATPGSSNVTWYQPPGLTSETVPTLSSQSPGLETATREPSPSIRAGSKGAPAPPASPATLSSLTRHQPPRKLSSRGQFSSSAVGVKVGGVGGAAGRRLRPRTHASVPPCSGASSSSSSSSPPSAAAAPPLRSSLSSCWRCSATRAAACSAAPSGSADGGALNSMSASSFQNARRVPLYHESPNSPSRPPPIRGASQAIPTDHPTFSALTAKRSRRPAIVESRAAFFFCAASFSSRLRFFSSASASLAARRVSSSSNLARRRASFSSSLAARFASASSCFCSRFASASSRRLSVRPLRSLARRFSWAIETSRCSFSAASEVARCHASRRQPHSMQGRASLASTTWTCSAGCVATTSIAPAAEASLSGPTTPGRSSDSHTCCGAPPAAPAAPAASTTFQSVWSRPIATSPTGSVAASRIGGSAPFAPT